MGRYSTIFEENSYDNNIDVPVIENFDYSAGAHLRLMGEATINENASFDDSMKKEFNELACTFQKKDLEDKGLMTEAAAIQVVSEGFGDVWAKLKGMVMKAWQKIKSLYEALKVKITAFLTRDYNKFYKKHENAFNNNYSNYEGKFKFKVPTKELNFTALPYQSFSSKAAVALSSIGAMDDTALKKRNEEISDGSYLDGILGGVITGATRSGFKKDMESFYFGDKDSFEKVTSDMVKAVQDVLGNKKIVKDLTDAQSKNNEYFKKLLSEIDKVKGKVKSNTGDYNHKWDNIKNNVGSANIDTDHTKSESASDTKILNTFSKTVTVNQTANNMINGTFISLVKMHIAQCKALFTKVVSKSKMNEQVYLDAVAESAYDETLETLDTLELI